MGDISLNRWQKVIRYVLRREDRILQVFCVLGLIGIFAIPYKAEIRAWTAALLIVLTGGCGTIDNWTLTNAEVPFKGVIETDYPNGRNLYGYANRETGEVEIKRGLPPVLRECVITHEKRHLKGYSHPDRKGFVTDCGDGTMVGG